MDGAALRRQCANARERLATYAFGTCGPPDEGCSGFAVSS